MTTIEELRDYATTIRKTPYCLHIPSELFDKAAAELEALQKEVERLRKETPTADAMIWREACNRAEQELSSLRAEVEELQKDKERLDKVLAIGFNLSIWSSNDGAHYGFTFINNRADLDAAILAEKKP